jgi:four helix bundle protein
LESNAVTNKRFGESVNQLGTQQQKEVCMNKLEFAKQMQARKEFAVQVVRCYGKLPKSDEGRLLGRQFLRAGTSTAANYRAACRAKSEADFTSKLGTVVEEADETLFWLELLEEASVCPGALVAWVKTEADELLRIFGTSLTTARRNALL